MEEDREQPLMEPANALNLADENSAVSDDGSRDTDLGKFKNTQALLDAYNSLQAEFTKKCQLLSSLQQDKTKENLSKNEEIDKNLQENSEINENFEDELNLFLDKTIEAEKFSDEIKSQILNKNESPFEKAWASVVYSHLKTSENKQDDPIVKQYILNDENVRNKIIENYLDSLTQAKTPVTISSRTGERLSDIQPDNPKSLAEAKDIVSKMFS